MDENRSPQDVLNEILENSKQSAPPPQRPRFECPPEDDPLPAPQRPQFEYPPADDPLPSPPPGGSPEKGGWSAKLLPWLFVMLGAALLILGVCVIQLTRMDQRLDFFQETVSGELGSVEQLRKENESLQASVSLLRERVQKSEAAAENLKDQVQALENESENRKTQVAALNTLWLLRQFMEAKDYPMAALAAQYGNRRILLSQSGLSPLIDEQFRQDRQLLTDQGWLTTYSDGFVGLNQYEKFPDQSTAETLTALWGILDSYYCDPSSSVGAHLPILYFDLFGGAEYTFLRENCSGFTLQLYQRIVDDLVDAGQLQWEEGQLVPGPSYSGDYIYYGYPD